MRQAEAEAMGLRLLGSATTGGSGTPPDPLDPARAVRRALADARLKAFEIAALTVSVDLADDQPQAEAFARRALGPHGETVRVATASNDHVLGTLRSQLGPGELGVAVSHPAGATTASCLEALSDEESPGKPDQSTGEQ